MKRHIPNTVTSCNLISGCIAICFAYSGQLSMALLFIVVGAVFDFFDGLTARLLKVSSPIGKELDSLADVVTFGVAPSMILYYELGVIDYPSVMEPLRSVLPYSAFVMAAFSALRLAKFNLDERQSMGFIGMPTPANALFWGSLIVGFPQLLETDRTMVIGLVVLMLISCWLLVCEVPMFALKFKHWGIKDDNNLVKYGFVVFSIAAFAIGHIAGISVIIVAYVLVSVIINITKK